MDSDAFILPDYIHGCAFRSHHGHTHGGISARSPLRPLCFFFVQASAAPVGPVLSGYFIPLFFIRGGYGPQQPPWMLRANCLNKVPGRCVCT